MGMTYVYTERQAKEYARKQSEYVCRRYHNGDGSDKYGDEKHKATNEEAALIERGIGSALLGILEHGEDGIKSAVATAEYFVAYNDIDRDYTINTYLSIAIPVTNFIKERESRGEYHISPEEYYARNKTEDSEEY